jgi:hypothetical protein
VKDAGADAKAEVSVVRVGPNIEIAGTAAVSASMRSCR